MSFKLMNNPTFLTMTKKHKYYPNNWEAYNETPSHWFDSIPYEDFMDWKIAGWEIPSSISCIIRERNIKTGKVKEHVYRLDHAAKAKCKKLMEAEESEFTVVSMDHIHHLTPKLLKEYKDENN